MRGLISYSRSFIKAALIGKSRKDTTMDELEAELLDDADLLDVDDNIDDDDDLFKDL